MKCEPIVRLVIAFSLLFGTDTLFYAQSSAPTRTPNRLTTVGASQLDELVAQSRYMELQRGLSVAELTTSNRAYFEGIVADRPHHVAEACFGMQEANPS